MTFASNVFEVAGSRGSYLYAFHHLGKLYGLKAGTPSDLAALPARLQADEKLRGHFGRMLASMRGADGMNELDLLTTVALAFGGPGVALDGQVEVPDDLVPYFEPIPVEQFEAAAQTAQPASSATAAESPAGSAAPAPESRQPLTPQPEQPRVQPQPVSAASAVAAAQDLAEAREEALAASSQVSDPKVLEAVERLDLTRAALERRLEEIERLVGGIARDLKGQATGTEAAPANPADAEPEPTPRTATEPAVQEPVAEVVPPVSTPEPARPAVPAMARLDLLLPRAEFVAPEHASALEDVPLSRARVETESAESGRSVPAGRAEGLVLDLPPADTPLLAADKSADLAAEASRTAEAPPRYERNRRNAPQSLSLKIGAPLTSAKEPKPGVQEPKPGAQEKPARVPEPTVPAAAVAEKSADAKVEETPPVAGPPAKPPFPKRVPVAPVAVPLAAREPEPQASSRVFLVDEPPFLRKGAEPAVDVPSFLALEPARSRFGMVVLWILVIAVCTAIGVGAAWYYRHQQAVGIQAPSVSPAPAPGSSSVAGTTGAAPTGQAGSPSPGTGAGNAARPAVDPTQEVTRVLNQWADAAARNDVTAETSFYAAHLDRYFQKRDVSRDYVRFDKSFFRQRGRQMQSFRISNLHYLFPTQDDAVVTLTKTWSFRWGGENIRQTARSRLWLHRTPNGWKITGEQDLTNPVEE